MKNIFVTVTFVTMAMLSFQASATLLVNGSFEEFFVGQSGPVLGVDGSFSTYNSLPGWTGIDNIELQPDGFLASAVSGNFYAELNAHPGQDVPFVLQQEFATVVGQEYQLSFYAQKRRLDDGTFNVAVGSLNEEISTHETGSFNLFTFLFTAEDELSTLSFISNQSGRDTIGHFLDDVSVTAVPLPGALLLFTAGIFGLGAIRKTS